MHIYKSIIKYKTRLLVGAMKLVDWSQSSLTKLLYVQFRLYLFVLAVLQPLLCDCSRVIFDCSG